MTVYVRDPACYIHVLDAPTSAVVATLRPIEFAWSWSDASAPAITSTLTIPSPTIAEYAALDPGKRPLVHIFEGVLRQPETTRRSYMGAGVRVIRRTRNDDNSVTLSLASPEQDLIDYSPPAVDQSNWARQSNVVSIIRSVLAKVYGGAQGTAWDLVETYGNGQSLTGTFPTYSPVTNLCTNGGFEYGTAGWVGAYATIAQSSTQKHGGGWSMTLTPNTSNQTASRAALVQNLQPATTYTLSAWIRTNGVMTGAGAADGRKVYVVGATAGTVSRLAETPMAPNQANQWNQVAVTFTTPSLMDAGSFELRVLNGTTTANLVTMWVDDIMLVEGPGLETDNTSRLAYFDGDTVDGTAGYNYAWQGDAGNSSSTRTPIVDRAAETLTWSPGQSAWDFLEPIMQAAGARFTATYVPSGSGDPTVPIFGAISSRYVPSTIQARIVEGANLYSVTDDVDLAAEFSDGTPMFADAVILRYSWTDTLGTEREAIDAYPTAGYGKPWYRELEEPFPGPGRAQGLYLRMRARASMLTIVCAYDPTIAPARQVAITSSQIGGSAIGVVDQVDHDPYAGTSTIRTKNTISYPTNAWVTKTTPWSALTGTWADQ